MTDKVQKILSKIATRKLCTMDEHMAFYNDKAKEDYWFLSEIEEFIKASQEESVSEGLDSFAIKYAQDKPYPVTVCQAVKVGANWQKEQLLAKAVEGKVLANGMGNPILHLWDKGRHLIDKKVKVIVIKED